VILKNRKAEDQPLTVLSQLALIGAAAILTGMIVPGLVAWLSGVFYQEGIDSVVSKRPMGCGTDN
jgi:hypothetical protein